MKSEYIVRDSSTANVNAHLEVQSWKRFTEGSFLNNHQAKQSEVHPNSTWGIEYYPWFLVPTFTSNNFCYSVMCNVLNGFLTFGVKSVLNPVQGPNSIKLPKFLTCFSSSPGFRVYRFFLAAPLSFFVLKPILCYLQPEPHLIVSTTRQRSNVYFSTIYSSFQPNCLVGRMSYK